MSKNKDSWLDEILENLGEAYHNSYPDIKAHKEAKQQILKAIKEKIETDEIVNVMVKMERSRILEQLGIED